jgi:hypothetical protein
MMACGHTANAVRKTPEGDKPCCVICSMTGGNEGTVVAASPDLSQRRARCAYYGHTVGRNNESNHSCGRATHCMCEEPSSDGLAPDGKVPRLAFFEYLGPGSNHARTRCSCGLGQAWHGKSDIHREARAKMAATCKGVFAPCGGAEFDKFYCGCHSWD